HFRERAEGPGLAERTSQQGKREWGQHQLGSSVGGIAHHHVTFLVGDHAGELGLILSGFDSRAIDVNESAWQREGVYITAVHHLKRPGIIVIVRGYRCQPPPKLVHIVQHHRIVDQRHLLIYLSSRVSPFLDILRAREEVKPRLEIGGTDYAERHLLHEPETAQKKSEQKPANPFRLDSHPESSVSRRSSV